MVTLFTFVHFFFAVPIIPELLYNIEHPDVPLSTPQNKSTASISSDISNIFEDISNLLAGNGTGSSNVTIASPYAIDAGSWGVKQ